jgi:hypothetical protein
MSLKDDLSGKLGQTGELRVIASGHRMHVEDPAVFSAAVIDSLS